MEHILFIQKVKKEKKDEYIKYHKEAWQDLLKEMKSSGIEREMIWLFDENIIIYVMAENFDESYNKFSRTEVFQKWLQIMTPLLKSVQDYSKKGNIQKLEKIFDLEEQIK